MPRVHKNKNGSCPYCEASSYDTTLTEERRPQQKLMFCISCSQWSVRSENNGFQYPIENPLDKETAPAIFIMV